jgi:hypothetical protein
MSQPETSKAHLSLISSSVTPRDTSVPLTVYSTVTGVVSMGTLWVTRSLRGLPPANAVSGGLSILAGWWADRILHWKAPAEPSAEAKLLVERNRP